MARKRVKKEEPEATEIIRNVSRFAGVFVGNAVTAGRKILAGTVMPAKEGLSGRCEKEPVKDGAGKKKQAKKKKREGVAAERKSKKGKGERTRSRGRRTTSQHAVSGE